MGWFNHSVEHSNARQGIKKPEYNRYEVREGRKVEAEHTQTIHEIREGKLSDKEAEDKIAKDHLRERPDYYTKLKQVESK
jgi:hypothetical protein